MPKKRKTTKRKAVKPKKKASKKKEKLFNPKLELVRLVTAGSVDDGKSTLIGRLLHDCNAIFEDQFDAVKKSSRKKGFSKAELAHLLDGLASEREQGITIDVAYRYFTTPKRRFIISDVPGHEQYTRNMVTGASNASVALLLADARKGLLIQSKRHLTIAALLGIPHICIVVNKMDTVKYKQEIYDKIKKDFIDFSAKLPIKDFQFIPISALKGDMVVERGKKMDWYKGRTLLDYLENLQVIGDRNLIDFRFPVQYVVRPNQDLRGYAGKVEGGVIRKGEEVVALPSGKTSKVKAIYQDGKKQEKAFAPQAPVIELADELDVSRGEMISRKNNVPEISHGIEAYLCWMSDERLDLNKKYILKHTTRVTRCSVSELRYRMNIDNLHREKTKTLKLNEIGKVVVNTNDPLMFDAYQKNRHTGSFIIIDELTNNTVGAGIILNRSRKSGMKKQMSVEKGGVLWFTGLSGSGKSTVADKVEEILHKAGARSQRLDGDLLREELCSDLGFTKKDRDENIKRAGFLSGLLSQNDVLVLSTFISPYQRQRNKVKKQSKNFVEIFVNCPLGVCEKRDTKGLYKKARKGEIDNFTGVSDPYEKPKKPDLELRTDKEKLDESAQKVIDYLLDNGFISRT